MTEQLPNAAFANRTITYHEDRADHGFAWDVAYDLRFDGNAVYVNLDVDLVGDFPTYQSVWYRGVNNYWNDNVVFGDGTRLYEVKFQMDFVNSNAHQTVTVVNGFGRTNMTTWYSQTSWPSSFQDEIAAHEVGHMLGNYDEYSGGATRNGYTTTGTLMSDLTVAGMSGYYWTIEYFTEKYSGKSFTTIPIEFGTSGNNTMVGTSGQNAYYGLAGNDWILGAGGGDLLKGAAGNDTLHGQDGADQLIGGGNADGLLGGAGRDTLDGGGGNDRIIGGGGIDTALFGGNQRTIVDLRKAAGQATGHGFDTIQGIEVVAAGGGADRITGNGARNKLLGEAGSDLLMGMGGNDQLYGATGNDSLKGGNGNDSLFGGANFDKLYGGGGRDRLYGDTGRDTLWGGAGDDRLFGGDFRDSLYGNAGNDTLKGGNGNDLIVGDKGRDVLYGGLGRDRYLFDDGFGKDKVFGFVSGVDKIDLRPVRGLDSIYDATLRTNGAGNAVLDLGKHEITIVGKTWSTLYENDFLV